MGARVGKNQKEKIMAEIKWSLKRISTLTSVEERQIQRIVAAGFISKPEKAGDYDLAATIRGIIEYYKKAADKVSDSKAFDLARREKSQANITEMEEGKLVKTLCLTSDYKDNFADAIAQGVSNIMRLPLTGKEKEMVLKAIRDVKLPALEEKNR